MNKIALHITSFFIGIFAAYYSQRYIQLPSGIETFTWSWFAREYWWMILIFFVSGYVVFYSTYTFITTLDLGEDKKKKKNNGKKTN